LRALDAVQLSERRFERGAVLFLLNMEDAEQTAHCA
jgi:hypothetical protein